MKTYVRIVMFVTIFVILIMNMSLHSVVVFAWGDSTYLETGVANSHRQFYTLDQINNGDLGNTITFNSITNASIGDERYFVSAQKAAPDGRAVDSHGIWEGGNITAEDGKEYVIRLFVHNNNPGGKANISTGTKVAVSGISQSTINKDGQQEVEVNGFIESDNAIPKEYWDCIRFRSSTSFHLDYVYGSAMIYNRGAIGTTDPISSADMPYKTEVELANQKITGKPLGDDIVLKTKANGELDGQLIGFDALDGNVPGCYQYSSYITIRVKAVFNNNFAVKATARLAGEKNWSECIDAKVGDKIEFQIEYTNTSSERQDGVAIKDILPANLRYIEGSTKIKNANYPNGKTISEGYLITDGLEIGSYNPDSNAYLMFTAEVVDDDLSEGLNTIENIVSGGIENVIIEDSVKINIQNNKGYDTIITVHVVLIAICFCVFIIMLLLKIFRRSQKQES